MLNWIWLAFILVSVLVGGLSGKLPEMTKGAFEQGEAAVMKVALPLIGVWAIWLGIMRLAERSGLITLLARALQPIMRRLFPEVPADHPAIGSMVMNMAANMLGLGNAATPLGLRAMAHLERLNPRPGVATNAMCTFLALNTASIQLIPTTAIGILAVAGSKNATAIVPSAFLATVIAACSGVIAAKVLERLPMFRVSGPVAETPRSDKEGEPAGDSATEVDQINPKPVSKSGAVILVLFLIAFVAMFMILAAPDTVASITSGLGINPPAPPADFAGKGPVIRVLNSVSILAVPFLLSFFPLYAALRGVKVYEEFVVGAREAFGTAQRVIPYLVAMLLSLRLMRDSGVLDALGLFLGGTLAMIGFPVDLLPLVLMRPLSGSATQGIFVELVNRLGPDTLVSRMAATIYGSTETTFYVLAVYFGAVAIRQTRHAIAVGLIADAVAVIASVSLCHVLFGS